MELNPDFRLEKRTFGAEKAPLLVIDNFVKQPDDLIRLAAVKNFVPSGQFFPGIRAKAPRLYQRFVIGELQDTLLDFFELEGGSIRFSMCHYSLVTTPPEQLVMEQRVPHLDSPGRNELASIHYLFRKGYDGTAFYRHRKTGYEYVDESRKDAYFRCLVEEANGPGAPGPAYINGDTPLFEQIEKQAGMFNRMLIYRRNSLHSGCIGRDFVVNADPRTGRLSINSFIDTGP